MSNNKLYTRSYFCKRLKESTINHSEVIVYENESSRKWTLLIFPTKHNILCTCHKEGEDFWFRFETSENQNLIVKTKSMKVIIDFLKNLESKRDKIPNV